MELFCVEKIGKVVKHSDKTYLSIEDKYRNGLTGIHEFGHVIIIWWFDQIEDRSVLEMEKPYIVGPDRMGVFALRQPQRPNPIAISVAKLLKVDYKCGILEINYIDANENSPIIDIKPYIPSLDWVEHPIMPSWCKHWPDTYEKSLSYDWKREFTFYKEAADNE